MSSYALFDLQLPQVPEQLLFPVSTLCSRCCCKSSGPCHVLQVADLNKVATAAGSAAAAFVHSAPFFPPPKSPSTAAGGAAVCPVASFSQVRACAPI